jgi:nucleoside-diphosphate-sugar epimerase
MKVCVLGANGFIGKNLVQDSTWVGISRKELDLMDQDAVHTFFNKHTFDVVVHCAASIDQVSVSTTHTNILMFENVVRAFKGKLLYFSSGAALRGDPPTDPYGLSKWIIDRRIETIPNAHCLRVWGCYGPGELSSRFSAICKERGHIVIKRDKYFDFVDVMKIKEVVVRYVNCELDDKEINLVDPHTRRLSQWAEFFGATCDIEEDGLDEPYILKIPNDYSIR